MPAGNVSGLYLRRYQRRAAAPRNAGGKPLSCRHAGSCIKFEFSPVGARLTLGCGPLGILHLLSERVGSQGVVVGLEREPRFRSHGTRSSCQAPPGHVTVLQADVMASGLQNCSFDFAHERLVMVNMSSPETLLAELVDLVRPRGIVAVEEIASWLCQPPHPSWDKLLQTFHAAFRASGRNVVYRTASSGALCGPPDWEDVQYKVHVDVAMAWWISAQAPPYADRFRCASRSQGSIC